MNKKFKILIAVILLLIVNSAYLIAGFNIRLVVKNYEIETGYFTDTVRLALLTDFHTYSSGENLDELLNTIDEQKPQVILLGGDIFDNRVHNDNIEILLEHLTAKYPCYYVTGNHEYANTAEQFEYDMTLIESYGVHRLEGDCETLTINGQEFNLCGVDDPNNLFLDGSEFEEEKFEDQIENAGTKSDNGLFTVFLSHRPEYINLYTEQKFDLILSGHTHGGQVRLPPFNNGLYSPGQGWFPEYGGGEYKIGDTTMIVSRGLANQTLRVPRFYNNTELVIIDLK